MARCAFPGTCRTAVFSSAFAPAVALALLAAPLFSHECRAAEREANEAPEVKKLVFSDANRYGSPAFVCDFLIHSFGVSSQGKYAAMMELAVPLRKTRLEVWNVARQGKETTLEVDGKPVIFEFSPDERLLAICDSSGSVTVYTTKDWWPAFSIRANWREPTIATFSKDSNLLLVAESDGSVQLIDLKTQSLSGNFNLKLQRVQLAAFTSPKSASVLGTDERGRATLKSVEIDTGRIKASEIHDNGVVAALCPDGRAMLVADRMRIRRVGLDGSERGEWCKSLWADNEPISSLVALDDNKRAIVLTRKRLVVVNVDVGEVACAITKFHDRRSARVNGALGLVAMADCKRLRLWDPSREFAPLNPGHASSVVDIACDPSTLRTFTTDTVSLLAWSEPGKEPKDVPFPGVGAARSLDESSGVFLKERNQLLVAPMSNDSWVAVDTKELTSRVIHKGAFGSAASVALRREGNRDVFWACSDAIFVGMDAATGTECYRVGERAPSAACALSAEGDWGIRLDTSGTLTLLSLPSGEVKGRRVLGRVTAWSPRLLGDRFAVAGVIGANRDDTRRYPGAALGYNCGVYTGKVGEEEPSFLALRPVPIKTYAFSSNTRFLAVSRNDGTIELWDVATNGHVASANLPRGLATTLVWEGTATLYVGTSLGVLYKLSIGL